MAGLDALDIWCCAAAFGVFFVGTVVGLCEVDFKLEEGAGGEGEVAHLTFFEPAFFDKSCEGGFGGGHGEAGSAAGRLGGLVVVGGAALGVRVFVEPEGGDGLDGEDFVGGGVVGEEHSIHETLEERDFVGSMGCGELGELIGGGVDLCVELGCVNECSCVVLFPNYLVEGKHNN